MRWLFALGVVVMCLNTSSARDRYSEEQLRLAAHIGAVIALVKRCGIVEMPTREIQAAMRAEGLRDRDLSDTTTAFHKRVVQQTEAVALWNAVLRHNGSSEVLVSAESCRKLVEMFGPRGWVRAELVPVR